MREEANWYQNGHIRPLTHIQLPKGIIKRAREVFSQRKTELIITEFYFPSSLSIISRFKYVKINRKRECLIRMKMAKVWVIAYVTKLHN
jgi:hypothetical protein